MFIIFTGMLPYIFFSKNIGLKRVGQNGGKKPLLVKKKQNNFFWLSFLSQNYFY